MCRAYTGVEVHPCRVCCKVYHELCLKKKGKLYDQSELEAFRKANTETGWSCHDCVSTVVLLMYRITKIIQSNAINNCLLAWNKHAKPWEGEYSRFQVTGTIKNGSKNQTPEKSFDYSCHLKSRVPPCHFRLHAYE